MHRTRLRFFWWILAAAIALFAGAAAAVSVAGLRDKVAMGVPEAAIITDNKGINTFETARFELALERHGVAAGGHVHARNFEARDFHSLAREVVGYAGYAFKGD